jgi:hypothetical protein
MKLLRYFFVTKSAMNRTWGEIENVIKQNLQS